MVKMQWCNAFKFSEKLAFALEFYIQPNYEASGEVVEERHFSDRLHKIHVPHRLSSEVN